MIDDVLLRLHSEDEVAAFREDGVVWQADPRYS